EITPPADNVIEDNTPEEITPPADNVIEDNTPEEITPPADNVIEDNRPVEVTPPVGAVSEGDAETQIADTKRGFFGNCKDITYKIMQSVYHGLQKIQQGVHNMKKQRIINKNERAIERTRGVKSLKDEYGDMSIDEINEITLKDAAALANQNDQLKKRLGEKRLKLAAELDMADAQQKHEINQRLRQLDALAQEVAAFDAMGGKDAMENRMQLAKLENKLKLIEERGEIDLDVARAKGKNRVNSVAADGRISRFRRAGQAVSGFVRGLGDKTKDDVTSASNAAKIAKKQLAKAKTTGAKKVWENAAKNLAKLMNSHEYTEEQKAQIAEQLIQESLRQAESAK
ncbi:MAG: hypothetical protein IIV74_00520, partial [Alphaproteobacteria bacterium]|nr:hypothetical protein [Alphaproteobacteria bacterium]